jgi:serine/threonine-protein kinase
VVYLAEHVFIEKKVAIKILSEDFARKADLVARFMQEAKAASKIGHENIIDITDFGETPNGSVFFVMEFLDGADLAHHIKSGGAMQIGRAKYIMNQICRALGAAHSKGIIHRDMKPENIYLVEREGKPDFVKILDFGIAKISSLDEGGSRLTRTGMIFGTPEYMSPEQARGDKPDHRVDIYAVGCILYEMLTGDTPFHADTFMGVLTKHMFETPVPPSQKCPDAQIPAEIEAVVLKALAKDRDQRYQTMKEVAVALEEATGGDASDAWGSEGSQVMPIAGRTSSHTPVPKPPSRPSSPAAAEELPPPKSKAPLYAGVGLVLALGGVGAFFALQKKPLPPPPPVVVKTPEPKVEPKPVEPAKPVEVKRSRIDIRSTPADVQVFNGPELLGATPASLDFTADTAPFEVTLKKKGFKEQKLRIAPDRNREYVIEMAKEKSSSSGSTHVREKPATPEPKVEAKPEPKVEPKPAGKLRDLKDPFAN